MVVVQRLEGYIFTIDKLPQSVELRSLRVDMLGVETAVSCPA